MTAAARATSAIATDVFGADLKHVHWFGARILRSMDGMVPRRILDVGCGDGALLIHLAQAMPGASLVGVDLSESNVAAAREAIAVTKERDRIRIIQDNYLRIDEGTFDLVTASSSLQGIDIDTGGLAEKLARDISTVGRLIHVTPYRCAYNAALNTLRKGLRSMRGRTTDRMILSVAKLLHPDHPGTKLRERVSYMYLVLRHDEDGLRAALSAYGFRLIASEPAPHTSVGQPKHRFAVLAR